MSRESFLTALQDAAPSLLPFVRLFYGRTSIYYWWDDTGRRREVHQGEGCEQGDPLAPALYAIGQHAALLAAQSRLQADEEVFAFLDDLYVLTTLPRARVARDVVAGAVEAGCGIASNHGKTRIFGWSNAPAPPEVADLGPDVWRGNKPPHQRGFVVLGAPIGHPAFIQAWADERLQEVGDVCRLFFSCVPNAGFATVELNARMLPKCPLTGKQTRTRLCIVGQHVCMRVDNGGNAEYANQRFCARAGAEAILKRRPLTRWDDKLGGQYPKGGTRGAVLKEGVELPPTAASARREREWEIVGTASQRGGTSMNSFDARSDRAAFASMAAEDGQALPYARCYSVRFGAAAANFQREDDEDCGGRASKKKAPAADNTDGDLRPSMSSELEGKLFRYTGETGEFMLMFVEQIVDIIVQCSLARHIVALCRVIHSMPSTAMTSNATVSFITVTVLSFT
ncbi:hypothetical protein AK812_SmicGene30376 [Symbiodinium microadriaticum]|uniref:Reverse transcriptase domain-containing protein n=1 Tax=Symbiodinium microadriaticum TaxID=2951 RepID=A0A1Q9CZJ1_SYMMI|nr:hypothetical protein AK812_SmicGene30376 [Symbiodinium microadriaticum]